MGRRCLLGLGLAPPFIFLFACLMRFSMHSIILATHDAYVGRERTGLLDSYASRFLHTLSIRNEIMKYEILWRMNQVQQLDKV